MSPGAVASPIAGASPLDDQQAAGMCAGWPAGVSAAVAAGRVLAVHAATADWLPFRDALAALLDDDERARVARLHRVGDRDERVVAYGLHRIVAAVVTGTSAREVRLARDDRGCPQLGDARGDRCGGGVVPAPGRRLRTSLSHGDGVVAIAIAAGRVGVDVESSLRAQGMAAIRAQVCHPDEASVAACEAELLALWVRKEALLKATGAGLTIAMHTFRAPAAQPLPWPDGAPGFAAAWMLDAGEGLQLALAAAHGTQVDHARLRPAAQPEGLGAARATACPPARCPDGGHSRVR